ncbi:transcriptional activator NhaR [Alteromonadaceae bacterium M269]|nr:transcriptional activator NhaR [Alteromonadaceae bacterium M269]
MKLNFKHLYYFLVVTEEGSITKAAERLHLTPQTVSSQLSHLEQSFGQPLLTRQGRHWVVTDSGAVVVEYAKDIFELGKELSDVMRGTPSHRPIELIVGITDAIPKALAYKLIQPALNIEQEVNIKCFEGTYQDLVGRLAVHSLDVVLADRPIDNQLHIKAYSHLLKHSTLSVLGSPKLNVTGSFPENLNQLPFLLPSEHHWLSRVLYEWFDEQDVSPIIKGQFDDSALMKTFAKAGIGACCMPTVIEKNLTEEYDLKVLGHIDTISEHYYALTVERKITNPAIQAICQSAIDKED